MERCEEDHFCLRQEYSFRVCPILVKATDIGPEPGPASLLRHTPPPGAHRFMGTHTFTELATYVIVARRLAKASDHGTSSGADCFWLSIIFVTLASSYYARLRCCTLNYTLCDLRRFGGVVVQELELQLLCVELTCGQ